MYSEKRRGLMLGILAVVALSLVGCGGGSGGDGGDTFTPSDSGHVTSPDGRYIAFERSKQITGQSVKIGSDLWIENSDGTGQYMAESSSVEVNTPVWSKDSLSVAWIDKGRTGTGVYGPDEGKDKIKKSEIATKAVKTVYGADGDVKTILQLLDWQSDSKIMFYANRAGTNPPVYYVHQDGGIAFFVSGVK